MTLGIVSSAVTTQLSEGWDITRWSPVLAVGYFVAVMGIALIGTIISAALSNPVTTLTGYVLVAASLGLLLGPMVTQFETASILKVFVLTAIVVIILGVIGSTVRSDLSSLGLWLLGGLLFVVGGMVIIPLMGALGLPVEGPMTVIDWIALAVFGGLVILTLNRALRLPYTHGNAMNSAVGMYTGFLGVVIRLSRRPTK